MPGMIEREITIDSPVHKVFTYLADFPRHSEWADVPLKVEQASSGPIGEGTTFWSVGHQLGRDFEATLRVTEFVPNRKLTFEAEADAFHFRHQLLLEEEEGRTRLTKGVERLRIGFPFSMLLPLLSALGVLQRGLEGDLRRIKARVEGT